MHADELTRFADYAFNRNYVKSIGNKTKQIYTAQKNKATFTTINIGIRRGYWNFFHLDIGTSDTENFT